MPSNQKSELEALLELAQRRVRTLAGAKLYGKPIGSPIGDLSEGEDTGKRPVTFVRLQSLQRQFLAAKKTGNTDLMKDIQSKFSEAFREFTQTRQAKDVLHRLSSNSGNNEQDIQEA